MRISDWSSDVCSSDFVLSRDRIALKVAPEVSDLDFSAGIQIGGVAVPALTVRRTDTSIELGDGETFVISGLVSTSLNDSVNKLPWLRSEEHTSELQSLMRISSAVICLKKQKKI